jgi:hypothetical protein
MEMNQTISINDEPFNKRHEFTEDRFTKGFNAWKKSNYRRQPYREIFRRKRTIKGTIEFLEQQCFELVVANIIVELNRKSDNMTHSIDNNQLNFEISLPGEEQEIPTEEMVTLIPITQEEI